MFVVSALAEALLAAQRQAIGAASKAFVAGTLNESDLLELLDNIGARDTVEQGQLLASLHVLQRLGTAPLEAVERAGVKGDRAVEGRHVQRRRVDGTVLMPRYEVSAWVGQLTTEVEADNEDDAFVVAQEQWNDGDFWADASYEVRELSD